MKYCDRITVLVHVVQDQYLVQLCNQLIVRSLIVYTQLVILIQLLQLPTLQSTTTFILEQQPLRPGRSRGSLNGPISGGSSEETWNKVHARWNLFKNGTQLTPKETTQSCSSVLMMLLEMTRFMVIQISVQILMKITY